MFKVVYSEEGTVRHVSSSKKFAKSVNNLITKDINPDVSLSFMSTTDLSEVETTEYNRIYYVISGKLLLKFQDNTVELEQGDSCHIDKGTKYEMSGTFGAVVVNQPAFGTR